MKERASGATRKPLVTRAQADQLIRFTTTVLGAVGRATAGVARFGAGTVRAMWRALQTVPAAVRGPRWRPCSCFWASSARSPCAILWGWPALSWLSRFARAFSGRWRTAGSSAPAPLCSHMRRDRLKLPPQRCKVGQLRRQQAGAGVDVDGNRSPPAGRGGAVPGQDCGRAHAGHRAGQPQLRRRATGRRLRPQPAFPEPIELDNDAARKQFASSLVNQRFDARESSTAAGTSGCPHPCACLARLCWAGAPLPRG